MDKLGRENLAEKRVSVFGRFFRRVKIYFFREVVKARIFEFLFFRDVCFVSVLRLVMF